MGSLWAKDVVNAWKGEEGYECGPNKWNVYADLLDRVDYFTGCGKKQNLDFCTTGVCWGVYVSIKYPDYEEDPESAKWSAHYFLYQSDNCDMAAVVKYLYQYFADNGATTDNPERGDIAIFQKEDGTMYHCGGVTDWDNDYIYITEFNTEGGKVKTHAYPYSAIGNKIKCFCRPRYDGWEEEESVSEKEPEKSKEDAKPTPEPDVNKYEVCVDEDSFLNVREAPSKDSKSIWKLYKGDIVPIYEEKDGWGRIDEYGWVYMEYLKQI